MALSTGLAEKAEALYLGGPLGGHPSVLYEEAG